MIPFSVEKRLTKLIASLFRLFQELFLLHFFDNLVEHFRDIAFQASFYFTKFSFLLAAMIFSFKNMARGSSKL